VLPVSNVYNLGNVQDPNGGYMTVHTTWTISNNALTILAGIRGEPALHDRGQHRAYASAVRAGRRPQQQYRPLQHRLQRGRRPGDRWVDGNTVPDWRYVIAVRLVVVARSAQPEIPAAARRALRHDHRRATWSGSNPPPRPTTGPGAPGISTRGSTCRRTPNWQCYRYKTFETTVPVRNWI
jgi:hypothetical protein